MDKPPTGLLHVEDSKKLLAMLQKLVNSGNTVVVLEHSLDVSKSTDWIIDLGLGSGSAGGQIRQKGDRGRWRRQQAHLRGNSWPRLYRINASQSPNNLARYLMTMICSRTLNQRQHVY